MNKVELLEKMGKLPPNDKDYTAKPDCDMVDTDLCKHYQKKPECHYYSTHYVKCTRGNPHEPPT